MNKEQIKSILRSPKQLQTYLYEVRGLKPIKKVKTGWSVDAEVITYHAEKDNDDFCKLLLRFRKLEKAKGTYIEGAKRFICEDNRIHSDFWSNVASTFRSCIAKGTLIDIVRDVSKYPKGIPIEDVKEGDLIYCFDNKLNPTVSTVLWAGKTGYREVIRIHWKAAKGKTGYLDVTPEHLIRHVSGEYIEARNLKGDLRIKSNTSRYEPKIRVLSLARFDDELLFTGHMSKHNRGIPEHRFIYDQVIESIIDEDVIHHIDGNHFNNNIDNLEKTNTKEHARHHAKIISNKPFNKFKNGQRMKKYWEDGLIKPKYGDENPNSIKFTKFGFLKLLAIYGGELKRIPYCFSTLKKYAEKFNIDIKSIKLRYDIYGDYISKGRLLNLINNGKTITELKVELGINVYKIKQLIELYGIQIKKYWRNQYDSGVIGNHIITKIEYLNQKVDVYDIEVEHYHNFFANEICVHNSSSDVNYQNFPKHGDIFEGFPAKKIRKPFSVKKLSKLNGHGYIIGEIDYDGAEVKTAAVLSRDPVLIRDLNNNFDLHSFMAANMFGIKKSLEAVKKENKDERYLAKNNVTFATFYGAGPRSIAESLRKLDVYRIYIHNIWRQLPKGKRTGFFDKFFIEYSEAQVDQAQKEFYSKYHVFKSYQNDEIEFYNEHGYVENPLGFRRHHPLTITEILNTKIQMTSYQLLQDSMNRIDKEITSNKFNSFLSGQIHDSLVSIVHIPEAPDYFEMCKDIMLNPSEKFDFYKPVKLGVEIEIGKTWDDMRVLGTVYESYKEVA